MSLTPEQRRILDQAMQRAGFASVEQYAWHLRSGLIRISDQPSGIWGRMAHETLANGRPVDRASRAVAQRGHDRLDDTLTDALHRDT
jgi:hypothetical protein